MTEKKRIIIIAAFGDRKANVERLVQNIRRFVQYPITIVTTHDSNVGQPYYFGGVTRKYVDRQWPKGAPREGVRNSNYFKTKEVLREETRDKYNSALLLDDDMLIVNENFVDGFAIAEKFGAALPLNPRTFQLYNIMGSDVTSDDCDDLQGSPLFAPAHNFSPFFVSTQDGRALSFLDETVKELDRRTCRGTLAIWKAMWATGFTPVNLPQQWCTCGTEAEYLKRYTQQLRGKQMPIPIMMLHLGHEETRTVFRDLIEATINGGTI